MANRIYVVLLDEANPNARYDGKTQIAAGASYLVPVFWCSIFSQTDVAQRTVPWDEEDAHTDGSPEQPSVHEVSYPVLLTASATAKKRAVTRQTLTFEHLPGHLGSVYAVAPPGVDARRLLRGLAQMTGGGLPIVLSASS